MIAIRDFKHVPELRISDEAELDDSTATTLDQMTRSPSTYRFGVLVVDDSLAVRKHVKLQLQLFGIWVDCAEDGNQAFEMLKRRRYDAVFLDIILPDIDGYKICKSIKSNQATKQTPVIMLTGKTNTVSKVRGVMAGCDAYLTKPVEQEKLQSTIKRFIPECEVVVRQPS